MRSPKERLALMHRRAGELKRKEDRRRLVTAGGASLGLFAVLLGAILSAARGGFAGYGTGGTFAGASLLPEGAGGYVLTAVIAFTAGVIVTAVLRWYRKRQEKAGPPDGAEKTDESNPTIR